MARGRRIQGRNKPIANIEQWQKLYGLLQYFPHLSRAWVKGHAGNQYNELADRLARGIVQ
ncbi:MAG: hypothetical protein H6765_06675 [Candidatus Peribacteria bacterium]|nr:MAG: hypothetical protein H6765_06675 [Candidatus Peribacteria bacterium]